MRLLQFELIRDEHVLSFSAVNGLYLNLMDREDSLYKFRCTCMIRIIRGPLHVFVRSIDGGCST